MHKYSPLLLFSVWVLSLMSILQPTLSHSQESSLEKARVLNDQALKLTEIDPLIESKIKILGQEIRTLSQQGRHVDIIPIAEELLSICQDALGSDENCVGVALSALAASHKSLGRLGVARAYYSRILDIRRDNINEFLLLFAQSEVLELEGRWVEATKVTEKALNIAERVIGKEDVSFAILLKKLGELHRRSGSYTQAEPVFLRALAIVERAQGTENLYVAAILNGLSSVYIATGNYTHAETHLKRALSITEKMIGSGSDRLRGNTLCNLASIYKEIGEYNRAKKYCKMALPELQKTLGPENADMANCLNNLAGIYEDQGDYAKAEGLYKKAIVIWEKILGPEHPDMGRSLANLALVYQAIGDYGKVESLLGKALAIQKKTLNLEHPEFITTLNNLAVFSMRLGDYSRLEAHLIRLLEIAEKALGSQHPTIGLILSNLASTYYYTGDYEKAESFEKRALAINEKALGPKHPLVAKSLNDLALVYCALQDYPQAIALCSRALGILQAKYGVGHPDVSAVLNNLAAIYAVTGNFQSSYDLRKRAEEIDTKLITRVMGFTSEDQKIQFISMKKWSLYAFFSLIVQHLAQRPDARRDALNEWLKRKGIILESQRRFQEALVSSVDPQALKIFQDLSRVRAQLSKLTFSAPGKEKLDVYKKKMADLEAEKDRLEAKLSQLSQAFDLGQKIAKADCAKVARSLPANTVLIEFARIEMFNFKAKGKEKRWKPAHYLAFILHAGNGDKVGMIDLGNVEEIDKSVAQLKKEISVMDENSIKSSRTFYDLVFEPLTKELGDVKEIFISPDGNLNLIPFEVLLGPDDRYLIEDYTFNYLAAGRDVIGFGQIHGESGKALLMGDPDFDLDYREKSSMLRKGAPMDRGRKLTKRSEEMNELHFARLPGAREEVKAIQNILGEPVNSDIFLGSDALEEVLKQTSAPKWVHLATHGFFLKDQKVSDMPTDLTTMRSFSLMTPFKHKGINERIENPMLRSGFALAGANRSFLITDEQMEDGIVTSEEILGLKLRGTDMVVLSACNTGLGDVKAGEGVFGLRRAFAQAGAKSLVVSMWDVPDKETKELMVAFYKNITSGEMNRCQALREAALREMKIVKKRYGHAYPLYWGGFVLTGDPGQTSKKTGVK